MWFAFAEEHYGRLEGEKENNAGVVSDGHITKGTGCKAKEPELSSADEGAVENF